jgi:integrase/recombinase XerC
VQLRTRGLAPRSIAIALAAWRGLYAWWGRNGLVTINPVLGVRPPKAPKPLPKALPVDRRWRWPTQQDAAGDPVLDARDHAITELLYGAACAWAN